MERRKGNLVWMGVICLAAIFAVLSFQINTQMTIQNEMSTDLSQVEYLSSSTQRLSRMVITNKLDNRVTFYIDEQTKKYLTPEGSDKLYVLDDPEILEVASNVIDNWNFLYELYQLPEVAEGEEPPAYDIDSIVLASDNHFNSMTDLSMLITAESEQLNTVISRLQLYSYAILVLICLVFVNHLITTSLALKRSNELAAIASVDIATGLFNRSRCQEIFKDTYTSNREQQPAIIVIDLNDLKKTNDVHGHRVGDELIACFANLLKDASNVHTIKPFLGRYGGDEFVVYHKDIEKEEDIQVFLKELAFLAGEFNKNEHKKFNVSYAIGYAINKEGREGLSTRQLFDEADENMYVNKKEMKRIQAETQGEAITESDKIEA